MAQRRRWKVGRSELKTEPIGSLLSTPHLGFVAKVAAVIELMMPTLTTLSLLVLASFLLAAAYMVTNPAWSRDLLFVLLLILNCVGWCGLVLYGMLPFFCFSLRLSVLASLIHLPSYAIWKLSMIFLGRPTSWIRTSRQAKEPEAIPPATNVR